jgi:UDP-N-acetylmuramoyl-L-alanyl-D-glutamate--2,6-diaminopimelate ligase
VHTIRVIKELEKRGLSIKYHICSNRRIDFISVDSRIIRRNTIFIARRGSVIDTHKYIKDLDFSLISLLVLEDERFLLDINKQTNYVLVSSSNKAYGVIVSLYYEEPSQDIFLYGITGTNGKTSTAYIIYKVHSLLEGKGGYIGTIGYRIGEKVYKAKNTTPSAGVINRFLYKGMRMGIKAFSMEVSSHSLSQDRVFGLDFNIGIFTNLTRDHLDYHKTINDYKEAKYKLFKLLISSRKEDKFAIINIDDIIGREFFLRIKNDGGGKIKTFGYGFSDLGDFRISDIKAGIRSLQFKISYKGDVYEIYSPLSAKFFVYNLTSAFISLMMYGFNKEKIISALSEIKEIPGRFEIIEYKKKEAFCIVDYAHTEDALYNLLISVREIAPSRVIVVFGCGGDRDKGKRIPMGRVAMKLSDFVIITSDNPRSEEPMSIIREIEKGVKQVASDYIIEEDRKKAIQLGLSLLKRGDILVVAGKGDEDYQIIGNTIIHFSDREVIKEIIS